MIKDKICQKNETDATVLKKHIKLQFNYIFFTLHFFWITLFQKLKVI